MNIICTKELVISVCDLVPRCGSGDVLGLCRPAIQGYYDGLLNPLCNLGPHSGIPWDGIFEYHYSDCRWYVNIPPVRTINGGGYFEFTALYRTNVGDPTGRWALEVWSRDPSLTLIALWIGYSPNGSGPPAGISTPVGLIFTAVPTACGMTPPTLTITAKRP